jgi:EmrB/QacA subfamily drug resistance transporter
MRSPERVHEPHASNRKPQQAAPPERRRWAALVLLCIGQFMLIVDITVVQVALPTIGTDLGLGREALTWVVTTYTLVFGGLMVLGGRLADALGARRVLLTGLAVFTVASLVCGLAASGPLLIAGRAGQGLGAALLSPATLAIVTTTFVGTERNRALGMLSAIAGAGGAFGVLIGGVLTSGPGWEWVFYVNVPVGVLVLIMLPRVVQRDAERAVDRRVDVPGALVVTASTALLIYGLVVAGDSGWGAPTTLVPLAAAVVGYLLFGLVERRMAMPLVRPQTLVRRPVLSGTFLMLTATGLLLGLFFLTSLYLQHTRGFTALQTGLIFLPVAVALTVGAQATGYLIGQVGGRVIAVAGFTLTAAGAALLTRIDGSGSVTVTVLPAFVLAALGIGPLFVTATTTTMANVPPGEAGVVSGVLNTFHELGGSIGAAVVSTVAASSITAIVPTVDGFIAGYLAVAVAAGVAAVAAAALVPGGKPIVGVGHGHGA